MGGNKGRRPGRTWEGFAGRAKAPTSNQKKTRKYSRNKNGKRARATFRTHMGVPRNSHPSGDKNEPVTVTEATAEGRPWQTRAGGGGIPPPLTQKNSRIHLATKMEGKRKRARLVKTDAKQAASTLSGGIILIINAPASLRPSYSFIARCRGGVGESSPQRGHWRPTSPERAFSNSHFLRTTMREARYERNCRPPSLRESLFSRPGRPSGETESPDA